MKFSTLLTASFFTIAPVFAANIALPYNTGVTNSGSVAAAGSADIHYSSAGPETLNTVFVESAPAGAWLAPDSLSAWIGPDTLNGSANKGLYTVDYFVSFDLTGFDPSSVSLNGRFAADDFAYIYLNGVNTGIVATDYATWKSFTLNSGFIAGVNIIDFKFTNGGGAGGLRVEFDSAKASATPEPGSVALVGLGVSALGLLRRKTS